MMLHATDLSLILGTRLRRIWLIPIAALVFAGIANARNTAIINVNTFTSTLKNRKIVSDADIARSPYNSVLQLYSVRNGKDELCSAPVVEDRRIAVVPLHCVFAEGKLLTPITLYYESTRGKYKLSFSATVVRPSQENLGKIPEAITGDDWALLTIDQSPPRDVVPFQLAKPSETEAPCDDVVQSLGYSDDVSGGRDLFLNPVCHLHPEYSAWFRDKKSERNMLYHDCSMLGGGSGSPLYCTKAGRNVLAGVHDAGAAFAPGIPQVAVPYSLSTTNKAISAAAFYKAVMELKAELEF